MENAVKSILKWQKDAGNLEKPYSDFLESSFQIEEALEGFDLNSFEDLGIGFNSKTDNAKSLSRIIVTLAMKSRNEKISDVERLDKALDAIIFAIGSIGKLGLNAQELNQALLIVNRANQQKLGMPRDAQGKLMKPVDFVGPEVHLQNLLDKVKGN